MGNTKKETKTPQSSDLASIQARHLAESAALQARQASELASIQTARQKADSEILETEIESLERAQEKIETLADQFSVLKEKMESCGIELRKWERIEKSQTCRIALLQGLGEGRKWREGDCEGCGICRDRKVWDTTAEELARGKSVYGVINGMWDYPYLLTEVGKL